MTPPMVGPTAPTGTLLAFFRNENERANALFRHVYVEVRVLSRMCCCREKEGNPLVGVGWGGKHRQERSGRTVTHLNLAGFAHGSTKKFKKWPMGSVPKRLRVSMSFEEPRSPRQSLQEVVGIEERVNEAMSSVIADGGSQTRVRKERG